MPAGSLHGVHTERALENFPLAGRPVHAELVRLRRGQARLRPDQPRARRLAGRRRQGRRHRARLPRDGRRAARRAHRRRRPAGRRRHDHQHERQRGARQPRPAAPRPAARRLRTRLARSTTSTSTSRTNDTYPDGPARWPPSACCASWSEQVVGAAWRRSRRRRKQFAHVVKVGRTQLQDAVLTTLGREMGAYAEAFARDRWRIYKCEERLRVVNLGGTAIGTGLGRAAAVHLPRRRAPARASPAWAWPARRTSSRPRRTPTSSSRSAASCKALRDATC